jgi:phosphatidate cytidylyltransferase
MLKNNLVQRIISSLFLIPIAIYSCYLGGIFFTILVVICAVMMSFEWSQITSSAKNNQNFWQLLGVIYIVIPTVSLIWLRNYDNGIYIVMWLFGIVWGTDIGAYFCGRIIGGPKIMPKISPKKTWSGLIGGVSIAAFIGYLMGHYLGSDNLGWVATISAVLGIYAQIGDFLESWLKRKFGVKDSGKIIPGHGGILDRLDGMILVAPKIVLLTIFNNGLL